MTGITQNMHISSPYKQVSMAYWAFFALCVVALSVATWLTPHETWFNHIGKPDYEVVVPKQFGDWVDTGDGSGGLVVSPEQAAAVESVYSQVVSRAYQYKPTGEIVMLSVGYGEVQLRSKQLHRPEGCYSSQGFQISQFHPQQVQVGNFGLGLYRMSAEMGNRTEQVSYWIRVGDKIISGPATELNLKRMSMGLQGYIADGLLFRVSSIGTDAQKEQRLQDQFINDLLKTVGKSGQVALIGRTL
jgi:EpsI family protein